jgi:Notch-like protein
MLRVVILQNLILINIDVTCYRHFWLHSLTFNLIPNLLKPKNCNEYDKVSVNSLKISVPVISFALTYIRNRSLSLGVFPTCLKYSKIKPLFKNGNKTNMMNYRPISLLTSFSKVIEKIILVTPLHHIE